MSSKARYIMIGGFLGAGKTTTVGRLAKHLSDQGLRVGLITNDQAGGLVDTKLLRGQGYATEAARRLVKFAFEELDQGHVSAGWYHDNPASGHVLAKLGARHNGSKMRDCAARGRAVLCHDMLLTRADFLRKQAA